jgi:hypothetical protein
MEKLEEVFDPKLSFKNYRAALEKAAARGPVIPYMFVKLAFAVSNFLSDILSVTHAFRFCFALLQWCCTVGLGLYGRRKS